MSFTKRNNIQTIFLWSLLLVFSLSVTGKAGACNKPSMMEMSQGEAMKCCMERCRMKITDEAAKQACQLSRHALSPKETLSKAHNDNHERSIQLAADINPLPLFSSIPLEADHTIKHIPFEPPMKRHASTLPIYTKIQIFLI